MPERLRDYTPWRFAWHEKGKPSLLGLAAAHDRLSVVEESQDRVVLSLRLSTGKPRLVHVAHHKDGTRAWTAYRPSFIGVILTWLTFGIMLVLSFLTLGMFDAFGLPSAGKDPVEKLQSEVRRRVEASRTGAGAP